MTEAEVKLKEVELERDRLGARLNHEVTHTVETDALVARLRDAMRSATGLPDHLIEEYWNLEPGDMGVDE